MSAKTESPAGPSKVSECRPADAIFPAYGYMNDRWMWDVNTRRVPIGFMVDGRPGTASEWSAYLFDEVCLIGEFLWPLFDKDAMTWRGAAVAQMEPLTLADLRLMASLRSMLRAAPKVAGKELDSTHVAMFEQEDETPPGAALFPSLDPYLPKLPADTLSALKTAIKKMSGELGPGPLRFKEFFQRPRPYQVAFNLNRKFDYEFGHSAVSPALPSGHCMQGLVRHAAAYLSQWQALGQFNGALRAFQQHAVDYGDRRVYAGVHYPSDNIASWYLSLRLCDCLFGHAGQFAKDFMKNAVKQSTVFDAIKEQVAKDSASPYAQPMARLLEEMQRNAKLPEG